MPTNRINVSIELTGAGYWRARWTDHHGTRRARGLGRKGKVTTSTARALGNELERELNRSPGLALGEKPPTLAAWLELDLADNVTAKPATIASIEMAGRYMLAHWPGESGLDELTRDDAARFIARLARGELASARSDSKFNWHTEPKPAPATVAKYARTCKAILGRAIARYRDTWRLRNPFDGISGAPGSGPGSPTSERTWHYLNAPALAELLAACPNDAWRVYLKLLRIEGLRKTEAFNVRVRDLDHLGEPNTLRYGAVDLEIFGTLNVPSLARNKRGRLVPIFDAELAADLAKLIAGRPPEDPIIPAPGPGSGAGASGAGGVARNCTRKRLLSIIAAAGLEPWDDALHCLRRNAEADLANRGLPQYVVSRWIGHSIKVSDRYYLADPTTPGSGSLKLVG